MRTSTAHRRTLTATSLTGLLLLTSCADGGDTEDVTFLVTTPAWDVSYAPLAVAMEHGFYEDEGLNVEYATFPGATTTATQLEQRAGDLALLAPEPVVIGQANGEFDSVFFAQMFQRTHFDVATFSDGAVQEPEDLEGANIGVTAMDSSGAQIALGVAAKYDVEPSSLNMVEIGAGPQAVAAVDSGAVDALSIFDSQYHVMRNGGIEIEELDSEFVDQLNAGGLAALPDRLEEDPEMYTGVARALFRAIEFCQEDPDECVRAMWDMEPSTRDADLSEDESLENAVHVMEMRLEGSYALDEGQDEWGSFADGTWDHYMDYMVISGQVDEDAVDPEQLYDNSLIADINQF